MKNTVRGIPLHTLVKSGFCPAIKTLDKIWEGKYKISPSDNSEYLTYTSIFFLLAAVSALALIEVEVNFSRLLLFDLSFTMSLVSLLYLAGNQFSGLLRRLDKLLIQAGTSGLPELPKKLPEIEFYLKKICTNVTVHLLRLEKIQKFCISAEEQRQCLKDLVDTGEKLGLNLAPYDPYFKEAEKILEAEAIKNLKSIGIHA